MPFTVITLTNAPPSLRGYITKWMQEISTGVYIGNLNSKVREQLRGRVLDRLKNGSATISYAYRNEIGYQFATHNTNRENVDYDGIPLVIIPTENAIDESEEKLSYSNASTFLKARKFAKRRSQVPKNRDYVIIDVETTGLDYKNDKIIEIGALKYLNEEFSEFNRLITVSEELPNTIEKLTGITNELLSFEGISLDVAIKEFNEFIKELPLIGFNINFDIRFINESLKDLGLGLIKNEVIDLLPYVKRDKMFIKSYTLDSVLLEYDIAEGVKHRALSDCLVINELLYKVNGFVSYFFGK